jgi:hypothetical protein
VNLPSGNLSRTLRYLDAIDSGGGTASRMEFYRIAGNEDNLERWEEKLCVEWKLVSRVQVGEKVSYQKTDLGQSLHRLLKNHEYVGTLFDELIRDRLRPT